MNPVIHFEMPAVDSKRMTEFYTKVFGWQTRQLGEEMGNYVTVTTSEADENGRPKKPGTINGGFYPVEKGSADEHPSIVIGVENIKESATKVTNAGGKIMGDPVEIPGIGLYVSFLDTEGNKVSLIQPLMK
jgi:uncharacterized protein